MFTQLKHLVLEIPNWRVCKRPTCNKRKSMTFAIQMAWFQDKSSLVYCNNIGLRVWCYEVDFSDSSSRSLNGVLLLSIYVKLEKLTTAWVTCCLQLTTTNTNSWSVEILRWWTGPRAPKCITLTLTLTKYPCSLCLLDSRTDDWHHFRQDKALITFSITLSLNRTKKFFHLYISSLEKWRTLWRQWIAKTVGSAFFQKFHK